MFFLMLTLLVVDDIGVGRGSPVTLEGGGHVSSAVGVVGYRV